MLAGQVEHRPRVPEGDVVERVVDDVLPESLVATALQVDDRRQALHVRPREREVEAAEFVGLDLEGQVLDPVVAAHSAGDTTDRPASAN